MNNKSVFLFFVALSVGVVFSDGVFGSIHTTSCLPGNGYDIECGNVPVPVDHTANGGAGSSDHLNIYVAIVKSAHPQHGTRQVIFMPQGGPGVIGTRVVENYIARYTTLLAQYDLVFFDTRGMGQSCGLWCPQSYSNFIQTVLPQGPGSANLRQLTYAQASTTFMAACHAEWILPDHMVAPCIIGSSLPLAQQYQRVGQFIASTQVVEDIEAMRVALGYGKIVAYGRSYSNQLFESFGALHPNSVQMMVLDCVPDDGENITSWLANMQTARHDAATRMGYDCYMDSACSADVCPYGPARCISLMADVSTILASQRVGLRVNMPLADGSGTTLFRFTKDHWEGVFQDWAEWVSDRPMLMRYLEQARRGDLLPLFRAYLSDWALNADGTIDVAGFIGGTTYSNSAYPTTCGYDYSYSIRHITAGQVSSFHESDWDRITEFLAEIDVNSTAPMGMAWITDVLEAAGNPTNLPPMPYSQFTQPYFTTHTYPVLLIESEIDPQVHPSSTRAVYNRLAAAGTGTTKLVTVTDGQHVSYLGHTTGDAGFECVANIVENAVLHNQFPSAGITNCAVAAPMPGYIALPPVGTYFHNLQSTLPWVDNEVYSIPEFWWGGESQFGCDYQGSMSYSYDDNSNAIFLISECDFFDAFPITGNATYYSDGSVSYYVYGNADMTGTLYIYNKDVNGNIVITTIHH